MDARRLPKVDGSSVQVDPQLLFQRLETVAKKDTKIMQDLFRYERSNHPSSLFEASGFMRQAKKATLTDYSEWE